MSATTSLMSRAVALLARREHSRHDLARKMRRYTQDEDEIIQVLDTLEDKDLLSDRRFAEVFVRARKERFGCQRLSYELSQQRIETQIIDEVLAPLADDELERAREVWLRKFNRTAQDQREYARQYRFLGQRGFNSEIIRKVLSNSTTQSD
ncbi:MAG TPA: recombination regulator RecX [Paenalcaligenes sp.]|nr:recombination regulator RecX [Paenalcaligenes sp.]